MTGGRESSGDGIEPYAGWHASKRSLTHRERIERAKQWAALLYVTLVLGWVAVEVATSAGCC